MNCSRSNSVCSDKDHHGLQPMGLLSIVANKRASQQGRTQDLRTILYFLFIDPTMLGHHLPCTLQPILTQTGGKGQCKRSIQIGTNELKQQSLKFCVFRQNTTTVSNQWHSIVANRRLATRKNAGSESDSLLLFSDPTMLGHHLACTLQPIQTQTRGKGNVNDPTRSVERADKTAVVRILEFIELRRHGLQLMAFGIVNKKRCHRNKEECRIRELFYYLLFSDPMMFGHRFECIV